MVYRYKVEFAGLTATPAKAYRIVRYGVDPKTRKADEFGDVFYYAPTREKALKIAGDLNAMARASIRS